MAPAWAPYSRSRRRLSRNTLGDTLSSSTSDSGVSERRRWRRERREPREPPESCVAIAFRARMLAADSCWRRSSDASTMRYEYGQPPRGARSGSSTYPGCLHTAVHVVQRVDNTACELHHLLLQGATLGPTLYHIVAARGENLLQLASAGGGGGTRETTVTAATRTWAAGTAGRSDGGLGRRGLSLSHEKSVPEETRGRRERTVKLGDIALWACRALATERDNDVGPVGVHSALQLLVGISEHRRTGKLTRPLDAFLMVLLAKRTALSTTSNGAGRELTVVHQMLNASNARVCRLLGKLGILVIGVTKDEVPTHGAVSLPPVSTRTGNRPGMTATHLGTLMTVVGTTGVVATSTVISSTTGSSHRKITVAAAEATDRANSSHCG